MTDLRASKRKGFCYLLHLSLVNFYQNSKLLTEYFGPPPQCDKTMGLNMTKEEDILPS